MLIEIMQPNFIHTDDRGKLVQIIRGGFNQVNIIESKSGCVRGGHFHQKNREAFYIIKGKISLYVSTEKEKEEYMFNTGDMFLIPVKIIHSFVFIEDTLLLSMYDHGVELPFGSKDIITP